MSTIKSCFKLVYFGKKGYKDLFSVFLKSQVKMDKIAI